MSYSIVGIHTGIGKTVCSAVLCQALGYDYWKPVQAGEWEATDSHFVAAHVLHPRCKIHPERHRLQMPASPHYAAALEGITISAADFALPATDNGLIVETAGGLMSPLATGFLNVDLVAQLALPVILVSHNYLGSINHTLLTQAALQQRNLPVAGIVFVGDATPASESFILEATQLRHLFSIPMFERMDAALIATFAQNLHLAL
jgi:dethiobiotin synthetase